MIREYNCNMLASVSAKVGAGAFLQAILLLSLATICANAQRSAQLDPSLHTPERFLQEHQVPITKPAVITALRNDDAEVRKAASHVLSGHWPKEAAAPIKTAMLQEDIPFTRVSLATDLARLGDTAGREMLLTVCHNGGEWGSTRIMAARNMIELHDDSCLDSVVEILASDSNPEDTSAKYEAVNLVPKLIEISGSERQTFLDLAVNALKDPDLGVRIAATTTLGRLGDISVIAPLQAAATSEQDPTVHDAMLTELKRLKDLRQGAK